jgi:HAD superfamily hydrolase (TIGR01509 family)
MSSSAGKIQVVIFDLGGVLVDMRGVPTILEWMENRFTAEQLWTHWLSSPTVRDFERGRVSADSFAEGIIGELRLPVAPADFLAAFTGWMAGLYPGALELVRSLPVGLTRATLANTSSLHWPRIMEEFELEQAFHHHFPSHLTGRIKPDAEAFQHAIESMGCAPGTALFLDDNRPNVDTARSLGMHAVQVKGPAQARQALVEAGILKI